MSEPDEEPSLGRRAFVGGVAAAVGGAWVGCGGSEPRDPGAEPTGASPGGETEEPATGEPSPPPVPRTRPADWDPIAFNRERGNAGAIPESYRDEINGPEGETGHLGKHLPYVPSEVEAPEGRLALMWGDPERGYVRHPNAVPGPDNDGEGHWYDWVRVRRAVDGPAEEVETRFTGWPEVGPGGDGRYAVQGGGDITADSGKNTVYLVRLPPDVGSGDRVRVHAHCLTHGEYVDFLRLP